MGIDTEYNGTREVTETKNQYEIAVIETDTK